MDDSTSVPIGSENPTTSPAQAVDFGRPSPTDEATNVEAESAPAACEVSHTIPAQTPSHTPRPATEYQTADVNNTPSPFRPSSSQNSPPISSVRHDVTGVRSGPYNPQISHGEEAKSNWFSWDGLEWTLKDTVGLIHICSLISFSVFTIAGVVYAFPTAVVAVSLFLSLILYWYIPVAERITMTKCLGFFCICLIFLRASQGNWTIQFCHGTSDTISESGSGITMENSNLTCVAYVVNPKPIFFESANATNGTDVQGAANSTRLFKVTEIMEDANHWLYEVYNQLNDIFAGFGAFHVAIDHVFERFERDEEKMDEIIHLLKESEKDKSYMVIHH